MVNLGSSFEQIMMGPSSQCYIPSHKVIGTLVLKKIFEGFLPYMGLAAILVMWPRPREQTSFPHPTEAPYEIWLWQAKRFWRRRERQTKDAWTDDKPWLYYKLTNEPKDSGELKMLNLIDLDRGRWMALTFGTHKASCTHLADCSYQLLYHRLQ